MLHIIILPTQLDLIMQTNITINPLGKILVLPRWQPYRSIFSVTLKQILWRRKTILALLGSILLPVAIVLLFRLTSQSGRDVRDFIPIFTMMFYLLFLTVVIVFFHGTAIVADEIDGRTLTYLFVRPLRKSSILLSKFVAYLVGTILLITPSHLLITIIVATHPKMKIGLLSHVGMSLSYIGIISLGVLAYGAISVFLAVRFKHPVLWGLLIAFGWEKITLAPFVPINVKRVSVVHYLLALFPRDNMPKQPISMFLGDTPPSFWLAFVAIFLIAVMFLTLSIWIFQRREYLP